MQIQADPRVRKRMACTLSLETRRHSGLILNLSERGLFVQTSLPAEPGTLLDLDVRNPIGGQPIPIQAAVVWRRRVSPRMTGVTQSGMGLRLIDRPSAWQSMLHDLLGEEGIPTEAGATKAKSPKSATKQTAPPSAQAAPTSVASPVATVVGKASPDAKPSLREEPSSRVEPSVEEGPSSRASSGPTFLVRLALDGGPRSRRLLVDCEDEIAARSEAIRLAGSGWSVLEVRRR